MTATTRKSSHAASAGIEKPGSSNHSRGRPSIRSANEAPRAPRGRARGRYRASALEERVHGARRVLRTQYQVEADPCSQLAPIATQVARTHHDFWSSGPASLYFVQRGQLESSPDTEIMALNLIDFMLYGGLWDPRLQLNILAASCFFFASSLTGLRNGAHDIAQGFELDLDIHTNAWMTSLTSRGLPVADADTMRSKLRLEAEDIENGYAILWNISHAFQELVGDYAEELQALPIPMPIPKGDPDILEQEVLEYTYRKELEERGEFDSLLPAVEQKDEFATSNSDLGECEPGLLEDSGSTTEQDSRGMTLLELELIELDDFETSIEEYEG